MDSAANIAKALLKQCGFELIDISELQTLWAGYGSIYAIKARRVEKCPHDATEDLSRLVMKIIDPPDGREGEQDEGHIRKMLSYDVEQYFYEEVAPRLDRDEVAVAKCVASSYRLREALAEDLHARQNLIATILTDLRVDYPVAGEKRSVLSSGQVYATIDWLAKFHKSSKHVVFETRDLFLPPLDELKRRQSRREHGRSVWLNGGYTYLATRQSEYNRLSNESSEWAAAFCTPLSSTSGSSSTIAELVARFLVPTGRPFETCIHGDVKSENLFSNEFGDKVAFFDFQYAGLGLGVCDLAKLFTCSIPLSMLQSQPSNRVSHSLVMDDGEKTLLTWYWNTFHQYNASQADYQYEWDVFVRHWETALVDWCRFQSSWGFWGNTNWLQARVRSILADEEWLAWIHINSDE